MNNQHGRGLDRTRRSVTTTSRRLSRAGAGVITAGLLLAAAACSGDEPNVDPEPIPSDPSASTESADPSPTEPTTTEPVSDEEKAAAALLGYLDVRDKAYATGRISKKLNKYATGQEHLGLQQFVTTLNTQAKAAFEGDWVHKVVRVEERTAGEILATDCEDGGKVNIVRKSDGELLPWFTFQGREIPRRLEQTYRVVLEDDLWKVQAKTSLATKVRPC